MTDKQSIDSLCWRAIELRDKASPIPFIVSSVANGYLEISCPSEVAEHSNNRILVSDELAYIAFARNHLAEIVQAYIDLRKERDKLRDAGRELLEVASDIHGDSPKYCKMCATVCKHHHLFAQPSEEGGVMERPSVPCLVSRDLKELILKTVDELNKWMDYSNHLEATIARLTKQLERAKWALEDLRREHEGSFRGFDAGGIATDALADIEEMEPSNPAPSAGRSE